MKAYLLITGSLFALLAADHLVVLIRRLHSLASDPWFVLGVAAIFAGAAALAAWAWRLFVALRSGAIR